jgi:ribosomal 50S subunit-associated protein YjgA (DUF615 family)
MDESLIETINKQSEALRKIRDILIKLEEANNKLFKEGTEMIGSFVIDYKDYDKKRTLKGKK